MNPRTVLIVDDDRSFTDTLEDLLRDEGYAPCSAGSCRDGLELARQQSPGAALLDLKLPDGPGTGLLSHLRAAHPDCVCTIMTAYADLDSALAALEEGAAHYLQKPVRPPELLALLERIFEGIRLREEKREAEARLRMVFEAAEDWIFLKDASHAYTHVNPAMLRSLAAGPDRVVGRRSEDLFPSGEAECLDRLDAEALAGETVRREYELSLASGRRAFHLIEVPLRDAGGAVAGVCGIARDVTERRLLESQLAQAQKMEAVGTLAGGVAHDFNNLLQAIQGYADLLLLDAGRSPSDRDRIGQILKAADRARELTSQLLTFSRRSEPRRQSVDLNEVVQQAWRLLGRTIPKMIEIRLELGAHLRPVLADPAQLERVIINLGVNARDAMPDGGVLVLATENVSLDGTSSSLPPEVRPGHYAKVSVCDTGCGMDSDTAKRAFDPFFTTKEQGRGTGLGLAVAYGIVKEHEGHLLVRSGKGAGTTFSILLPTEPGPARAAAAEAPVALREGTETILLVDDEEDNRRIGEEMLRHFGYRVTTAPDGETALDVYRERGGEIDLVILDLIMPGMGGWRCLEELRRLDPNAKVLVASGYADQASDDFLDRAGIRRFLPKPYRTREMLEAIQSLLEPG